MNNENKFTTPPIVFDLEEKIKKLEKEIKNLKKALTLSIDCLQDDKSPYWHDTEYCIWVDKALSDTIKGEGE